MDFYHLSLFPMEWMKKKQNQPSNLFDLRPYLWQMKTMLKANTQQQNTNWILVSNYCVFVLYDYHTFHFIRFIVMVDWTLFPSADWKSEMFRNIADNLLPSSCLFLCFNAHCKGQAHKEQHEVFLLCCFILIKCHFSEIQFLDDLFILAFGQMV